MEATVIYPGVVASYMSIITLQYWGIQYQYCMQTFSNNYIIVQACAILITTIGVEIGWPWPLLNLRPLYRNVIFAIENHFSLLVSKVAPLLLVASSARDS